MWVCPFFHEAECFVSGRYVYNNYCNNLNISYAFQINNYFVFFHIFFFNRNITMQLDVKIYATYKLVNLTSFHNLTIINTSLRGHQIGLTGRLGKFVFCVASLVECAWVYEHYCAVTYNLTGKYVEFQGEYFLGLQFILEKGIYA